MSTAQTGSLWDKQTPQTGKFVVQANGTKYFNPNFCEKLYTPLKNKERTLENVACVCQKIMATLYDHYFPGAEALRPGPISQCPDSDILTIAWLLELIPN